MKLCRIALCLFMLPWSALGINALGLRQRMHLVGVISDICVLRDMTTKKTYTLRPGDALPSHRQWQVASVSRSGILLKNEIESVHLTYPGRQIVEETWEPEEVVDEGSLEYYRKILGEQRQNYQEEWDLNRPHLRSEELIICDADDQSCPIGN